MWLAEPVREREMVEAGVKTGLRQSSLVETAQPLTPAGGLLVALVAQAIRDARCRHKSKRRERGAAWAWLNVADDTRSSVRFTFEQVCEYLGCDPDLARRGIRQEFDAKTLQELDGMVPATLNQLREM